MIYSRSYLTSLKFQDLKVPLQRYYHKFSNKEFKRLKMHEKDFFFQNLKLFSSDENHSNKRAFDIRKIREAKEYCFYSIILTYAGNGYIDFDTPKFDYRGKISACEMRKDKRFFYEYLNIWKNQVNSKLGPYFHLINVELNRKLKLLPDLLSKTISKKEYNKKTTYLWAIFFHIYYKAKVYFDEKKDKFEEWNIGGFNIRFDVYSYVHILSRHYYPVMNNGMSVSCNSKNKVINMHELPLSILSLMKKHIQRSGLSKETEFLLYEIDGAKYILWIKYISGIKFSGFQIRSFYNCQEQCDLDKFIGKIRMPIDRDVFAFY